jgi:hypothetical protein
MKFALSLGFIVSCLLTVSAQASSPVPEPQCPALKPLKVSDLAPADEYFGKLKMSVLGMNNYLNKYAAICANTTLTPDAKSQAVMSGANNVLDALQDMDHVYPRETNTADFYYRLAHIYAAIGTPEASQQSVTVAKELMSRCPDSTSAKKLRNEVAQNQFDY